MRLMSGHASLKSLYDCVKVQTEIPYGRSASSNAYRKAINEICESIPDSPGLYLWGSFDVEGRWSSIYLGKSGKGKTSSLRARITEELRDEFVAFWLRFHDETVVMDQIRAAYGDRYDWHQERSKKKRGTDFIIWVYNSGDYDLCAEENALIARFGPSANAKRTGLESPNTEAALEAFTDEIEAIRGALARSS